MTKPVRSQSERRTLAVGFARLHVLPKAEEKRVNILSWDYKSVVFAVCKELQTANLFGHISHKGGNSVPLHQSGDVYLQNVEARCGVCEPVSVCECVWSKETLGSRDCGREKEQGDWVRYYQARSFVVLMTTRHTLDRHAKASLPVWPPPLLPLFRSHSLPLAHTESQTHAPKAENYSLACKHRADGLPNDCCVQCKGSVLAFPLHIRITTQ